MIIIQEVLYMTRLSRKDRFIGLSKIDRDLESMESLNDLIILYQMEIQGKLDKITSNKTLQEQLKAELGIKW